MSLILIQETASSIPSPAAGKGTVFLNTSDQLSVKNSSNAVSVLPSINSSTNTYVIYNNAGSFGQSANFVFNETTSTLTLANLIVSGTLQAGDISVSSISNGTSNVDIVGTSGNVTTSVAGNANIVVVTGTGVVVSGNLTANGAVGNGIVGGAKTSGSTRGTGVTGQGYVTASGDTGAAVGVRGFSTDTHSGGYNVGVLGNASGSGLGNYAFYVQAGNIASIETATAWDLVDNNTNALSFNSTGKANILGIETTDGAEGIFTSGYLNVSGNVTATRLISNIAIGTAPLTVTSTTRVANLNVATSGVANTVNDAAQGNITSVGTLTSVSVSGNANIGNIGTGGLITATGNVTAGNLVTGGALSVTGNANVGNLGTTTAIITTGNITTINSGLLQNGNSNIAITANGNISLTAAGGSPELVVTGTGANITGTLSASGNANVANLGVTGVFATTLSASGNANVGNMGATGVVATTLSASGNANVANLGVTGVFATTLSASGNANVGNLGATGVVATTLSGTLTTAAQPNITSVGTLTSVSVSGNANIGNIGTGGLITATGNITGGNLVTTGILSVTGTGVSSIAGNLDMTSNTIINLASPTNDQDAATKKYVDDVAQGLNIHPSCNAATTTTLASISGGTVTYNNGTAGVGATLTTTGSYTTIDGVTLSDGMRILVKNEATQANNGIYVRTSATVLTRATDFDTAIEIAGGDFTFITAGTQYNSTGWVQIDEVTTVGTDPIVWEQFSGAGTYSAGTGLTLTGTTFSVNASQTQVTSTGTLTSLSVSGNINAGNVSATLISGTITTASQANITSVGQLTSLSVSGNATVGNVYANSGTVGASLLTGTLTTAAQGNITSVGTLTGLGVNGTITGVNITANTGVFTGNGSALTALNASNISSGTLAQARLANSSVTLGSTALTLGGTVTTVAGLSSVTSTSFVGALTGAATSATTAGTVTTAAQPNITSVGTLTGLTLSNAAVISVGSNTNVGTFTGNFSLSAGSRLNATYADLAEKYVADADYEPGTVLVFGGNHEVTLSTESDSFRVAGVVTTNPAYTMNNDCEGEHVATVALQGRVPVKVIGPTYKGDLLVSCGNGYAIANNIARAGTIIGKSLENFNQANGVIEVAIGRF